MSGSRGPQGAQGCKGDKGDKGATGAQGAQGITGARGPGGQYGNKGAQGDKGDKGNRGAQGYSGEQGPTGKIGCRGDQGYRGPTGDRGLPGWQGVQGPQGSIGDTGFKGPQGDDGSSVIFGTTGPSTGSTHYSGLSKIYFDENTFQIDPIDGSGIIISSGLKVGVTGSTTTSYGHINTLLFDSESGFDITSGTTGTAIIGMNSTFKYWQVDGNTGLQAKGLDTVNFVAGDGITITPDKTASPYQSLTIASTGGGNSDISGPPPQLTFGNISYTSRYIYIPWEYPAQSTIIGDTYLPYIHSFSAYYTINDISHNIIVDGSGSEYIKGPPSSSNQPKTYITGIILTNVSTGTPTPGTCTQVQFPDNNISRWYYIHYDPSLSLLSEAGASGTITAYYSNYNTSSGVSNKSSKTLNGFSAAGIPSTSTTASFSYTYPDALLNTKNVDIAVNVVNTTPYSNGSTGPWIDKDNKGASTYQIQKYKYIYESNGSTIRYDVPLADASQNVSGDISLQTIHYLYPDASYMLYEQVNNNSSTDASYSEKSVDPILFSSQSLQVRGVCKELKFATLTQSYKSAYLVTDTNRQNLKTNVIFTEPSEQVVTSDPVISPIHTLGTRGNLVPIGTTLLEISCTITKSGSPTPIDSVSISYKGFDTTYNIPAGSTGTGICTIKADDIPVDSYADSSGYYQGFYLETSNNSITLKNPSTLFAASNQLNTIQLAYIRRNNAQNTSTDISYSSYSFYYDPYSTSPSISSFSASLTSMATPIKISGVEIITGNIGLTGTTNVLNIGSYFYVNGAIITYSTGQTEAGLENMTTNPTLGALDASCIFTNASLSVAAPTTYAASASISVNASSVRNCVGTSVATTQAAVTFNMLFDPLSITLISTASKYPASFPNTNGVAGIRVYSGQSNASGSTTTQTRFIPTFPNAIILTAYENSVVINDTTTYPNYSEDLQLFNGLIRTKGTTTQGYADYTANKISISANSALTYNTIQNADNAGYRYATFAWLCPVTAGTYSKITFTMCGVSSDITGVTTEQPQVGGANIYMFYRLQEGGTGNAGSIATSGNANTYWINAFGSSTSVSNTNIYLNSNPTSLGGDDTSLPSTFVGTTLTMYCIIPSFVVSNDILGNAASRIMYFRVGLPMAKDIGFEYITTSFS
jgi:hypothetical protein